MPASLNELLWFYGVPLLVSQIVFVVCSLGAIAVWRNGAKIPALILLPFVVLSLATFAGAAIDFGSEAYYFVDARSVPRPEPEIVP